MPIRNRPTVTEINNMNNVTLKSTLKELLKNIDEDERAKEADISEGNETHCELLKSILTELRKLTSNKEETDRQMQQLKEGNEMLMRTISQQQCFLEEIDADRRSCNLIVLGVSEDQPVTKDCDKISMIFNKLELPGPTPIKSMQRLGKKLPTNTRPRPIKVVLENAYDRQLILSNAKKLNDMTGALKAARLKKDVHPAIRREFGRLIEVEKKEKEKAENAGRTVAFDHLRRVVTVDGEVIDSFKPSFF